MPYRSWLLQIGTYFLVNLISFLLNTAEGAETGLEFTIVRPFNWIGPRMDFIPGIDGPSEGVPRVLACFSNVSSISLKVLQGVVHFLVYFCSNSPLFSRLRISYAVSHLSL